jgi:tRNA(Ile)-lysidine synthase
VAASPPAALRRIRLRSVEPILRGALRADCRLPRGRRLLVAVSGGADSVALLLGLANVAHEFGLELHAAHLHHGLRGAEADADLALVRALCRRLGIPLAARRVDARAELRRRGLSGQAGLRELRREFLIAAARRRGAAAIATAHTADDQMETVMMRMVRGTGLTGLGGMRPRRGAWLKPLLLATRADIERDLRAGGVEWREDRSNRDPAYLRNRIRLLVLPALLRATGREDSIEARGILARRAGRAAAEARGAGRMLHSRARAVLERALRIQEGEFALDSREVAAYPSTFQRIVLRQLWERLAPDGPGLTHGHLAVLERLLARPRKAAVSVLPGGWTARCDGESIAFRGGGAPGGSGSPASPGDTRGREAAGALQRGIDGVQKPGFDSSLQPTPGSSRARRTARVPTRGPRPRRPPGAP